MPDPGLAPSPGGYIFELPSLGADMETGTVLDWFVRPGDTVKRGDVVALVSTEKADIEVEIWRGGRVAEHLVDIGVAVPVGTPLLRLEAAAAGRPAPTGPTGPGERASTLARAAAPPPPSPAVPASAPAPAVSAAAPVPAPAVPAGHRPALPALVPAPAPPGVTRAGGPPSSPLARTLAAERGIDLHLLTGSGPGGAVVARDLDQALRPQPAPDRSGAGGPAPDPLLAMRRAIAGRMEKANSEIPHYFLDLDIDLSRPLAWLETYNQGRPAAERVLPAALLFLATARAAARVPELNGWWIDGGFRPAETVDLAMVVSLRRGGLLTPTIRGADSLDVAETMAVLKEMVTAARSGALRSSWMADASLTVTNLGDNGVDRVAGVIFPPQVALVGIGRTRSRPWVGDDGRLVVRPVVTVTLAADHRATDGTTGSRFLTALVRALDELADGAPTHHQPEVR